MKLSLPIVVLFSSNAAVEGVKCGKWYSTPCLHDADIRYDQDYTNDIIEQNPRWSSLQGYWRTKDLGFDDNFQPNKPQVFNPTDTTKSVGLPYTRDSFTSYYNFTIDGSRLIESVANVFPPAPQDFCDAAPSDMQPGDMTALRSGVCGETGYVTFGRSFYTSSHEKNGELQLLGGSSSSLAFQGFFAADQGLGYSVGDDALYTTGEFSMGGGTIDTTRILTFLNQKKTKASSTTDSWLPTFGDEYYLIGSTRSSFEKITEEEYINGIQQELDAQNVPAGDRPVIPTTCEGGVCPSEEDWCKKDPDCSVSPYQEPEASLNGGAVGGIVAACAAVIILGGYAYYRWRLRQVEKRVKRKVAAKIAHKLGFCCTAKEITPESISREFKSIDESGDGILQKDEVKAYFMAGGSGMTDQEFETLFGILDEDGSGDISFAEFVTFLNACKKDLEQVQLEKVAEEGAQENWEDEKDVEE